MEDHVQYRYKTIVFEFQKDGLLGDRFIDGDLVERQLNTMGQTGWELVNVAPVHDGLLAFLKKTLKPVARRSSTQTASSPHLGPVSSQLKAPTQTKPSHSSLEGPPRTGNTIGDIKIE